MRMKSFKKFLSLALGGISTIAFSACSWFSNAELLAKPATAEKLSYTVHQEEGFKAFKDKAENFFARFSASLYKTVEKDENFAVAPVSVFTALSLASECSASETQTEILSALGVTSEELSSNISKLYRSINVEHTDHGYLGNEKVTGRAILGNSIWLNEQTSAKPEKISVLANDYYCYSYRADFLNKNASANNAVQKFVKEQTHGLIDEDFSLPKETVFALINTLYLKDNWNYDGSKISLTDKYYDFRQSDGERESIRLMERPYCLGRAYESEGFTSFYTTTYNGYKLKFILPNENVAISDVFTAENIRAVNAVTDYNAEDQAQLKRYYTRCLFPQFEADFDEDVRSVLRSEFGVKKLFEPKESDFSPLTDDYVVCGQVRHSTELKVDRRGIEGASVTVVLGAGAPGPDEYEEVYLDFIVDRAFGFIITDSYNTTLFSGVVNEIDD